MELGLIRRCCRGPCWQAMDVVHPWTLDDTTGAPLVDLTTFRWVRVRQGEGERSCKRLLLPLAFAKSMRDKHEARIRRYLECAVTPDPSRVLSMHATWCMRFGPGTPTAPVCPCTGLPSPSNPTNMYMCVLCCGPEQHCNDPAPNRWPAAGDGGGTARVHRAEAGRPGAGGRGLQPQQDHRTLQRHCNSADTRVRL